MVDQAFPLSPPHTHSSFLLWDGYGFLPSVCGVGSSGSPPQQPPTSSSEESFPTVEEGHEGAGGAHQPASFCVAKVDSVLDIIVQSKVSGSILLVVGCRASGR